MSDETSITIASYQRYTSAFADGLGRADLTHALDGFAGLLPAGGLVIDLGTGNGVYARALQDRGMRVVAVDLAAGLLRVARAGGSLLAVLADIRRLPIATGTVNGMWACASLLHLPKSAMLPALREMRRVTVHGGAAYIGLKQGDGEEWVSRPDSGPRFFAYYQPEELDALLAVAGWHIIESYVNAAEPHPWLNRLCRAE